ncbi:MAG: type II CRISPR RNA-guided endonuclease Cas9 [Saccharofermentans sp.]|nr:type II CRISPR RNA-guided endonuclease Cas9 [Saccharofermentans sp.]
MGKILGLDVGIGSLGWAVVDEDKRRIVDLGVRIFESGEEGATKAADRASQQRRAKRATRRLNKRCQQRKLRLKKELDQIGLITPEQINNAYRTKGYNADVWRYRSEGLNRKLEPLEIASILINFANYRGYQDFYEDDEENKDGKLTEAKNAITRLFIENKEKYITVGNMVYTDPLFRNPNNGSLIIRNKSIRDSKTGKKQTDYKYLIDRRYLREETRKLLQIQREFGYEIFTPDVIDSIENIIFRQRDFEDGPGPEVGSSERESMNKSLSGSQKYTGFDELIGMCPFYPNERRGYKNSKIYDMYVLINTLSQLVFFDETGCEITCPEHIISQVWMKLIDNKGVYLKKEFETLCNKNKIQVEFPGELKKKKNLVKANYIALLSDGAVFTDKIIDIFREEKFDDEESLSSKIGFVLAKYATPRRRHDELKNIFDEDIFKAIDYAKNLKIVKSEGGANVSFKYMKEAINAYFNGEAYGDFQARFYKEHSDNKDTNLVANNGKLLPIMDLDMVKNPVVYRSLNEVRKIVNAVNGLYKDIDTINVEVARDVGMSFEQRKEVSKNQNQREANNEKIKAELIEKLNAEGYSATLSDKLFEKYILWKSQDGRCMYSDKVISFEQLLNSEAVQVDHIIPQSIIFDNTLNNKVIVLTRENQGKGAQIPMEYIAHAQISDFVNRVANLYRKGQISKIKREYLLLEELTEDIITGFVDRNINDTRTISKYVANYLRVAFENKKKVNVIKGTVTSKYRKLWLGTRNKYHNYLPSVYGFDKKTRDLHYYHHAIDAVIVANMSRPYIEVAQDYLKLSNIKIDIDRHSKKGNAATVRRLEADYQNELDKSVSKMNRVYGFSSEYTTRLLSSGYVPSICDDVREEVEVRVPLNIDMEIKSYIEMTEAYKQLKSLLKGVELAFDDRIQSDEVVIDRDQVLPDTLEKINSLIPVVSSEYICMRPNGQLIKASGDIKEKSLDEVEKELRAFIKTLSEKDISTYINSISMCSEDEYLERVCQYYKDEEFSKSVKFPYVSFKVSRKYRGGMLASDNPVSLKKTGFSTYKELELDMKNNIKSPYYVRFNKGIDEHMNFTIYDARKYYCVEVYSDESGSYHARGIRYVDLYRDKKQGKLVLKRPLPDSYRHEAYLFKNEYIRICKKDKLINNGFGAFRGVENINQDTIIMRKFSNKNLSKKEVYVKVYRIEKIEIDILGHMHGVKKCGDQSLFITEKK